MQTRTRIGSKTERSGCNTNPCPLTRWSRCSATCGGGVKTRTSNGSQTERSNCNTNPCPLTWSRWSRCSATCGGGTQRRTRSDRRIENQRCGSNPCPSRFLQDAIEETVRFDIELLHGAMNLLAGG